MTSLRDAEARLLERLSARAHAGQSSYVTHIDFVLCEDFESAMVYLDTTDEQDAVAACFDLDGVAFAPEMFGTVLTVTLN